MLASTWLQGGRRNRSEEAALIRNLLKNVSRSFHLSLIVLPRPVRGQMGLAYLFCRAADTIADTRILPYHERLPALHAFRTHIPGRVALTDWRRPVAADDATPTVTSLRG